MVLLLVLFIHIVIGRCVSRQSISKFREEGIIEKALLSMHGVRRKMEIVLCLGKRNSQIGKWEWGAVKCRMGNRKDFRVRDSIVSEDCRIKVI